MRAIIPDIDELREISRFCRGAEKWNRDIDVRIWRQLGWTQGGNPDIAWKEHIPMAPDLVVNGMTLAKAMETYPADTGGHGRSWNIPRLTYREDAALSLLGVSELPFVVSVQSDFGGLRRARVSDGEAIIVQADANTLALAICAAATEACADLVEAGRPLPQGRSFDPRF